MPKQQQPLRSLRKSLQQLRLSSRLLCKAKINRTTIPERCGLLFSLKGVWEGVTGNAEQQHINIIDFSGSSSS